MDENILTANHERILLSIDRSILTRNAVTPCIILVIGWSIYMFSIIIWKQRQCSKRFNCKNKLGGTVYPDQFNSSMDDDLKTIAEDDNICIRGLSYDKYRYDTLKKQMRSIRNRFFSLGIVFLILSLPTTMFIMYYSNIFDTIYTRVDIMEYRMDAVRIAMDLLYMKRSDVTNMAGELVTLLSDNVVTQTCFESSNQLLDASNDVISAMSSIRIHKSDIGDVKDVVMDAADISNEMASTLNYIYYIVWISIFVVTFINICVIVLMVGVLAATKGKCKPNHKLMYHSITFRIFWVLVTIFWGVIAVFSYGFVVNKNFCAESSPNETILNLLGSAGYEYSLFYYYTQNYIEGCSGGVEFGASIEAYLDSLQGIILGNQQLQSLMNSADNCLTFSSLMDKIILFNNSFEELSSSLNSASYIMNCDNVNQWYSEVTLRGTCTDLPNFSLVSLLLMIIASIVVSVMVTMNVALKTDMELFLDINEEDENNEDSLKKKKSVILIGDSKRTLFMKKEDFMKSQRGLSNINMENTKKKSWNWFKRGKGTRIEELKEDLERVFSANNSVKRHGEVQQQSEHPLSYGMQARPQLIKLTNDDVVQHQSHDTVETIQRHIASFFSSDETQNQDFMPNEFTKQHKMMAKDEIERQLQMSSPKNRSPSPKNRSPSALRSHEDDQAYFDDKPLALRSFRNSSPGSRSYSPTNIPVSYQQTSIYSTSTEDIHPVHSNSSINHSSRGISPSHQQRLSISSSKSSSQSHRRRSSRSRSKSSRHRNKSRSKSRSSRSRSNHPSTRGTSPRHYPMERIVHGCPVDTFHDSNMMPEAGFNENEINQHDDGQLSVALTIGEDNLNQEAEENNVYYQFDAEPKLLRKEISWRDTQTSSPQIEFRKENNSHSQIGAFNTRFDDMVQQQHQHYYGQFNLRQNNELFTKEHYRNQDMIGFDVGNMLDISQDGLRDTFTSDQLPTESEPAAMMKMVTNEQKHLFNQGIATRTSNTNETNDLNCYQMDTNDREHSRILHSHALDSRKGAATNGFASRPQTTDSSANFSISVHNVPMSNNYNDIGMNTFEREAFSKMHFNVESDSKPYKLNVDLSESSASTPYNESNSSYSSSRNSRSYRSNSSGSYSRSSYSSRSNSDSRGSSAYDSSKSSYSTERSSDSNDSESNRDEIRWLSRNKKSRWNHARSHKHSSHQRYKSHSHGRSSSRHRHSNSPKRHHRRRYQ